MYKITPSLKNRKTLKFQDLTLNGSFKGISDLFCLYLIRRMDGDSLTVFFQMEDRNTQNKAAITLTCLISMCFLK